MKNIIRKIIFAALFAAGLATSANAQEIWENPRYSFPFGGAVIDFRQPIPDIISGIPSGISNGISRVGDFIFLLDVGDNPRSARETVAGQTNFYYRNLNSMIVPLEAGDNIRLGLTTLGRNNPLPTVRVYTNAAGDLQFAQFTGRTGTADRTSDEFNLDGNWAEIVPLNCSDATVEASGNVCRCTNSDHSLSADGLSCSLKTSGGGSSGGGSAGAIIGGVAVVGGLIWLLSSGGATGEFNFTPDFGYAINESGYAANAGGRMDFRKDEWHLYYTGGQTNANGDFGNFRYSSGGKYTADFWTAAFSESVAGKTTDYDFSLSANLAGGIWKISPAYRMHSRREKDETKTHNSLNLESVLHYHRWTIRPSAGFGWQQFGEFANNAKFQMNAVYRF